MLQSAGGTETSQFRDMAFRAGNAGASIPISFLQRAAKVRKSGSLLWKPRAITFRTPIPITNATCSNSCPNPSHGMMLCPAGQLLLQNTGERVECTLILMQDIATKLPTYLAERVYGQRYPGNSNLLFACPARAKVDRISQTSPK